jgi:hypothetical protein
MRRFSVYAVGVCECCGGKVVILSEVHSVYVETAVLDRVLSK